MALREKQLRKAEKRLENDAIAFEEFLRDNDQKSVDALKTLVFCVLVLWCLLVSHSVQITLYLLSFYFFLTTHTHVKSLLPFRAAQETINKLQMTAELKKATMEVQAIKR